MYLGKRTRRWLPLIAFLALVLGQGEDTMAWDCRPLWTRSYFSSEDHGQKVETRDSIFVQGA